MNSVYKIPPSASSLPPLLHFSTRQWPYQNNRHTQILPPAYSLRRRNDTRRSKRTRPSPDHDLQMVIDVNRIKTQASSSLTTLSNSTQLKLRQFVSSGKDAYTDLQTLITVDNNQRVIISCRRSSVLFLGNLVIWSFVSVLGFRVLVQLGSRLGFLGRFGVGYGTVVRRDRSLGGREVVVGQKKKRDPSLKVLSNPLSSARGTLARVSEVGTKNRVRTEEKLPRWWPVLLPPPTWTMNKEEYQRKANRLIRVIMDNRMNGKDILEDDIIQLRQICRTSGARISIDMTNARDYFYRASVDFVLNTCSSAARDSTSIEIDGEDARQFIAGLADNIGLGNIRAARIVSAAVAARTRSRLLQAWALQMQGKLSEAKEELSMLCVIHRIFPPEESSAEMEMVARGLEKHVKVEQREFLMNMVLEVCCKESCQSMAEALGLARIGQNQ